MEQEQIKNDEQIKKEMIDLLMEKITGGLSEKVADYGTHPRNYGSLDQPDGYAKIKGPCGDTMEMFLQIRNDRIVDIAYTTDGCMTSHAAGTAATVMARGVTIRESLKINQSSILEHLGGMPEDSQHCALLAANTFHKALRHYAVGRKK
jgi:nitrogen fixation protein NifU and related proteins